MAKSEQTTPSLAEALLAWLEVAALSFGGPTAQIAVMHRVIVEEKKWVPEERFLHALNFCMLLPGPEAQQLATYLGWMLHGRIGGLLAGGLFILPGVLTILVLSLLYAQLQYTVGFGGIFFGLRCAVVAIVAEAALRIGRRILKTRFHGLLALLAFIAIFCLHIPFPAIIITAGVIGWLSWRGTNADAVVQAEPEVGQPITANGWTQLGTLLIFLALWFAPLVLLGATLGWDHLYVQEGWFFSKAAVVTFGGAYAVLPYVAQQAVERLQWLSAGQMQDGLGMAETTPGPLIIVVQFVGFMAAYQNPGPLPPWLAGICGSLVTVWVTFVPSFMWVFVGAPYVERLRRIGQLASALSAITAAVVGVVLNLAVWFTLQTLFRSDVREIVWPLVVQGDKVWFGIHLQSPNWSSFSPAACGLSLLCCVLLLRLKWNLFVVLAIAIAAGLVLALGNFA